MLLCARRTLFASRSLFTRTSSWNPIPYNCLASVCQQRLLSIATLDRARLGPLDLLSFPNPKTLEKTAPIIRYQDTRHRISFSAILLNVDSIRGFLYYHNPPDVPPLSHEIRFRVCPNDDPANFGSGYDLLRVNGLPWALPLWQIARLDVAKYNELAIAMKKDGLGTADLIAKWRSILPVGQTVPSQSIRNLIFQLGQVFPVQLTALNSARPNARLILVGKDEMLPFQLIPKFPIDRTPYKDRDVYSMPYLHMCLDYDPERVTFVLRCVGMYDPVVGSFVDPKVSNPIQDITDFKAWIRFVDKTKALSDGLAALKLLLPSEVSINVDI
ncbi:hypothetical protein C8J56DRAFT_460340 [Mycena floridula]|nr:hypothetical protein C8J56DRAFT_460340 [Mycena floridula]